MNRKERRRAAKHGKQAAAPGGARRTAAGMAPEALRRTFAAATREHQVGRLREAQALYRQILAAEPGHAEALHLMGVASHQLGDYQAAAAAIGKAIARRPGEAAFHYNLGEALRAAGEFAEAEACYRQVLALSPEVADAHFNLGNVLYETGRLADAVASYRRAVELAPADAEAHNNLGNALSDQGETAEAEASYRRALAANPDYAEAHANLGNALAALDQPEAALESYRRALALDPDLGQALAEMGRVLERLGRPHEAAAAMERAVAAFRLAVAARPEDAAAHVDLGRALQARGRFEEALASLDAALARDPRRQQTLLLSGLVLGRLSRWKEAEERFRRALRADPNDVEALNELGNALMEQNRLDDAMACFERAQQAQPDLPGVLANMGSCLQQQGRFADAARYHRRALEIDPDLTEALYNLALSKEVSSDEEVARLEEMAAAGRLNEEKQCSLHFALAKILDDRGDFDRAFAHYQAANAIRKAQSGFDAEVWVTNVERMIAAHPRRLFAERRDFGSPSDLPVFVLGMPRSGTTLVEQIIASHPEAFGAGELYEIRDLAAALPGLVPGGKPFPECLSALDAATAAELAEGHLARLRELAPEARRIVDKMPNNFLRLGLIARLFPNAHIIHCRRDAMDTCLSCYFQNFRHLEFSADLHDTGVFYRQYERLMAHWRKALPLPMLDVQYEEMVTDQETVSRGIIDFLGLEWDARCLAFHETERPIRTSSIWQARQPIYGSSIGRWRHYDKHLEPLKRALGLIKA